MPEMDLSHSGFDLAIRNTNRPFVFAWHYAKVNRLLQVFGFVLIYLTARLGFVARFLTFLQ